VSRRQGGCGNHQGLWSPSGYPSSDCSQRLQVLCHDW
jgi:hypothetical protein